MEVVLNQPLEAEAGSSLLEAVVAFSRRQNEQWLSLCNRFVRVLRGDLSAYPPEVEKAHSWLLRSARLMHAQMIEPAFTDRFTAERTELVLWHLEQLWVYHHNPMSEAEADALAAKYFPSDEPKA